MTASLALALHGISKRYPGVQALLGVDFECRSGEIQAIVGENGSGKSTLMGVAAGAVAPDEGTVEIDGHLLASADPSAARALGLAIAYQDTSLVPQLSVAQNLWLATAPELRPSLTGVVRWAQEQLDGFPVQIDAATLVQDLSLGQRQLLETLKAVLSKPRVLILDEPTNALGVAEIAVLQDIVRSVAAAGTAVVYISHRLPEVLSLAERLTVLRDGEAQGTFATGGLSEDALLSLMVGAPIEQEFPAKPTVVDGPVRLVASALSGPGFGPVDLEVREGEIVGLAGADGNGQREFVRALGGLLPSHGSLQCDARPVRGGSPSRALKAGIASLSGDRIAESLFPLLSVRENITVRVLPEYATAGVVQRSRERAAAEATAAKLEIVTPSIEQRIRNLSGGNQQKAVMGRAFLGAAKVVLVDEPTQGVDARARQDLYRALRALAAGGYSVVVVSGDALELAGMCDRVLVFSRGRVTAELAGAELSESTIVGSFLTAGAVTTDAVSTSSAQAPDPPPRPRLPRAVTHDTLPLWLLTSLLIAVSAYTAARSEDFATSLNLQFLLTNAVPLVLLAMAQLRVMLVGGIDLSVGAQVGLTTVLASFWLPGDGSGFQLTLGLAGILFVGAAVGLTNAVLVRVFEIPPVLATVGMLGVLSGIGLALRPVAGGLISADYNSAVAKVVGGFLPLAFLAVVVLVLAGDLWGRRSGGVETRAVGFSAQAARRLGLRVERAYVRSYVEASLLATLAGLFVATQIGVGDATVGNSLLLQSIAAAVLGGAALTGGRGTFLGCCLGGVFLALTTNIIPFLELPSALSYLIAGGLTLLAILGYSLGRK